MAGTTIKQMGGDLRTYAIIGSIMVSLVTGAFFAGAQWKGMMDREKEITEIKTEMKELKMELKHYTDLEVGGLRSDWERELKNRK